MLAGTAKVLAPHLRDRISATVEFALQGKRELLADYVIGDLEHGGLLCRNEDFQ